MDQQTSIVSLCNLLSDEDTKNEIESFRTGMKDYAECNLALHCATNFGLTKILTKLLKNGFDVNKRDGNMSTPLHIACSNADVDCVAILLRHATELHAEDCERNTPFYKLMKHLYSQTMIARDDQSTLTKTKEATFQILKMLFEYGYKIDATDIVGRVQLSNFVLLGPKGILELIIQHGYDIAMIGDAHNTLLHQAVIRGNYRVVREALNYIDVNIRRPDGDSCTALHLAVGMGDLTITELLLQLGAEVDAEDLRYVTPLCVAMSSHRPDSEKIAERLLQWRSKINFNVIFNLQSCWSIGYKTKCDSVIKHTLKRAATGIMSENDWTISKINYYLGISDTHTQEEYKEKIDREIARMKERSLGRNVWAYDVIIMHTNCFSRYVNNKEVQEFFKSNSHIKEFPLFADDLEESYKMASFRKPLVDNAEIALLSVFSSVGLTYGPIRNLVDKLTNADLKCLL